jgi:putative endonuclease
MRLRLPGACAGSRILLQQRGFFSGRAPLKIPCVYILASRPNGTLYVGVTSDLHQRMADHKQGLIEGFTKRYGVHRLVYYEMHEDMNTAIRREKRLKGWKRAWKLRLIERANPEWIDLFDEPTGALLDAPADRSRPHD